MSSLLDNSTLVYYVELQIEESAYSYFTELLKDKLKVINIEGHNAIATDITVTTGKHYIYLFI